MEPVILVETAAVVLVGTMVYVKTAQFSWSIKDIFTKHISGV